MKGDFSKYPSQSLSSFDAVLQQQGRVILDSDWNDQAAILTARSDLAAADTIGQGVAAVPVEVAKSFKVMAASIGGDGVALELLPGRVWVDGMLVQLNGDPANPDQTVTREADWLRAPFQDPPGDAASAGAGVRDAVILEVWRDTVNGFQDPAVLIEPALGGVDTTERLTTVCGYSLYRLAEDESCAGLSAKLRHNTDLHGKLTVSLQPTEKVNGDCPVERAGGYTGLEHQLYRLEIATLDSADPHFKWSRTNGGLVGRGSFDGAALSVALRDNQQAIAHSGRSSFYLEVLSKDSLDGTWKLTYGADATLVSDTELSLSLIPRLGSVPTGDDLVFRLWDGIERVDAFPAGPDPKELEEGIFLQFPSGAETYYPGDYWTFTLRAGGLHNPDTLLQDQAPVGPVVHRVAIAELMWNAAQDISFEAGEIEDCRRIFRPLILQGGCCTFVVGDGKTTHGDFDSLEEALRHLPENGGRLCLLPGMHETNLKIEGRSNIIIHGCGKHSTLYPRVEARTKPVISIIDSDNIQLHDLDMVCLRGTAVFAMGKGPDTCNNLSIENCRVLGMENGILMEDVTAVRILSNQIQVCDCKHGGPCLSLTGDNLLVRDNRLSMAPEVLQVVEGEEVPPPLDPSDDCTDPEPLYLNLKWFKLYLSQIWASPFLFLYKIPYLDNPYKGQGGLEIGGGSRDVRIENNHIEGGQGNGIALGSRSDIEKLAQVYLDPDFSKWVIKSQGSAISGYVKTASKQAQVGVALNFASSTGQVFSETSLDALPPVRNAGFLSLKLDKGEYRIASATPGYRIIDLLPNADEQLESFYDIIVDKADKEGGTPGFIYDLVINENRIEKMGGSGIGAARYELEKNEQLPGSAENEDNTQVFTADVIFQNLTITDNQLRDNLRDATGLSIFNPSGETGAGGIALGSGEGLVVRGNLIEDNGVVHRQAVCGIYGAAIERAEISGNTVRNNGPYSSKDSGALQAGPRGGIFINAYTNAPGQVDAIANGRFAARIHDNLVDHPCGPALVVKAIGPLSIQGNRFNCEHAALPGLGDKAIVIFNDGGGVELSNSTPSRGLQALGEKPIGAGASSTAGAVGGESRLILNFKAAQFRFSGWLKQTRFLPEGPVLFLGNQIRVGEAFEGVSAVIVSIEDDLIMRDNQLEALSKHTLRACVVSGRNVTVSGNSIRQSRVFDSFIISMITNARIFNNTSNNQASHCIYAHTTSALDRADMLLRDFNQIYYRDECEQISSIMKQWWTPLAYRLYRGNTNTLLSLFDDPAGLRQLVLQITSLRRIGFRSFKLYRGGYLASLQAESLRLSLRYGDAHPYRTQIENKVGIETEHYKMLAAENQASLIETIPLDAKNSQIHGRITDTLGKGLANLLVHFVDDSGKALVELGRMPTDTYGYYSLNFNDDAYDKYANSLLSGVFLELSTKNGVLIYHRFQPITVPKNETTTVEVALDPADIK